MVCLHIVIVSTKLIQWTLDIVYQIVILDYRLATYCYTVYKTVIPNYMLFTILYYPAYCFRPCTVVAGMALAGDQVSEEHVALQIEEGGTANPQDDQVVEEATTQEQQVVEEVTVAAEEVTGAVEGGQEAQGAMEGDRDSLVPGTGSINGEVEGEDSEEGEEEEGEDEEEEEEKMSHVVQGTTETILNKLEENLSNPHPCSESDLLQVTPGTYCCDLSSGHLLETISHLLFLLLLLVLLLLLLPHY